MKKALKILAILMAMLMLVSMATACKSANDDMDSILSGETNISGNDDNGDSGNVDIDDEGNDPSDPSNNKGEDKENGKEENNNPGKDNKEENKKDPTGDQVDDEKQQEIIDNYDGTQKYDMDNNPLLAESKAPNTKPAPGFDIDTTGFVKNNIKLADLKGKNMIMITARSGPWWFYYNEKNQTVDEWEWFDLLREEYGVKIKYIKTDVGKALAQNLTYQSSGKQLDIMPTHRAYFPQWMNLSQALDPYVNLKFVNNSPGVDNVSMEKTKWDGSYRCISPIGAVDVIWYNESMVEQLGLKDPHKTWQEGKWNWDTWKDFLISVPSQGPTGGKLCPWSQGEDDALIFWPESNGLTLFDIDTSSKNPKLINNFNEPSVAKSLEFYAQTVKGVDYVSRRETSDPQNDMFRRGTCIMTNTSHLFDDHNESEYAMSHKFNWVPYPAGPNGKCFVMNYGATMMLPRKMKVQKNAPYAVKIMELWANRFTESLNDGFKINKWQAFDYAARKEYFEFAIKNVAFPIGTNVLQGALTGDEKEYANQLKWSMYNNNWNTATAIEQLRNLAQKACDEIVKFGI